METTQKYDLQNVKAQAEWRGITLDYLGTIRESDYHDGHIEFMANAVRRLNGDNLPCMWLHDGKLHHFYCNLPKLIDKSNGGLEEAVQHSLRTTDWTLFNTLLNEAYVSLWNDSITTLMSDFAPYSMTFKRVTRDGSMWMFGGIIYHAPNDSGVGAPSFSVRMSGGSGWAIHT